MDDLFETHVTLSFFHEGASKGEKRMQEGLQSKVLAECDILKNWGKVRRGEGLFKATMQHNNRNNLKLGNPLA